jgi:hypothetical protein
VPIACVSEWDSRRCRTRSCGPYPVNYHVSTALCPSERRVWNGRPQPSPPTRQGRLAQLTPRRPDYGRAQQGRTSELLTLSSRTVLSIGLSSFERVDFATTCQPPALPPRLSSICKVCELRSRPVQV